MKTTKKIISLMITVVMAAGLTACAVSYGDITGEWTTKSINDETPAEYAKNLGVTEDQVVTNMKITDDDKLVVSNATTTSTFDYERKSNGIEVKEEGKEEILFSMELDKDSRTLTYKYDLGNGQILTMVMGEGTADLTPADNDGEDENEKTDGKEDKTKDGKK